MDIRVAEYNDFEKIAELHAQSWQKNYQGVMEAHYLQDEVEEDRRLIWQTRLINPPINQHVVVAEEKGKLCGFICAFGNHDFEKGTVIESLHVASEFQGKGIAKLLLKDVTEWIQHYFSDRGVYIEVMEQNIRAIEFYDHLGGLHTLDRIWHSPCGSDVPEWIYTWETPQAILSAIG
ncbi:GNAT family N-acetyltransferase [Vibrio spartinae]|uniref:Acetyltransferase n=1 Tax=Vibrio spartinae TaxID=1918945 RepID=A0A1N6MAI0_9VIBR|nr:GNAT family N-acetyltransferase [Vibrio spartinae]QMV16635.1 putative acetyltransferase [Vibrio spartinae]SIO96459.1 putative acetyltransferase [Vibrio spartinae]